MFLRRLFEIKPPAAAAGAAVVSCPSRCVHHHLVATRKSVAEVIDSVRLVGRETGFEQEGLAEASRLEAGFDKIREVVAKVEQEAAAPTMSTATATAPSTAEPAQMDHKKKKVAFLEWLEPLFNGGHWIPDLVRAAGGLYTMAEPGERATSERQASLPPSLCYQS